jgi:hypothetical protein
MNYQNDYLHQSGLFEESILRDDSLFDHSELLNDPEIDEATKNLFIIFFFPNKLSPLKISFNQEYFNDPQPTSFFIEARHISPSLIKVTKFIQDQCPTYFMNGGKRLAKAFLIYKSIFENILFYPNWFYHCFPDVAKWILLEGGAKKLELHFGNDPSKLIDNFEEIKLEILKEIIDSFKVVNNGFECEIIEF